MFDVHSHHRLILSVLILIMMLTAAGCSGGQKEVSKKEADPQQLKKMAFLNQTADEMYQKAMDGEMMEARNKLLQVSDQITNINFAGVTTIEGLNALTESVTKAKKIYNAASLSPNEGQVAVSIIRLATDALTHKNQPMWLQYYTLLQNDLSLMEAAVHKSNAQEAVSAFNKLNQHISLIHPSLLISREPSEVEKLDSLMNFVRLELSKDPAEYPNIQNGIEQLHRSVDELFGKKSETTAYLPLADPKHPIIWTLVIGAIISSILTFTGWRMFKGGNGYVTIKKKNAG
ncbi:sporulation protein YpjB [Paenibacillus eucommiae]|uniref:Sporulation protein YpjB n=1 Tax=Paenibacillus eucommiae TaxID=1355755 RepID=A0ABS4J4L3_9BACL|nr:sporulation protein YpjB [Paenibacillus eucommiae]MBP1994755.1 sporulation protein YpjB [Paenibacillus eucommiae]